MGITKPPNYLADLLGKHVVSITDRVNVESPNVGALTLPDDMHKVVDRLLGILFDRTSTTIQKVDHVRIGLEVKNLVFTLQVVLRGLPHKELQVNGTSKLSRLQKEVDKLGGGLTRQDTAEGASFCLAVPFPRRPRHS